MALDDQTFFPKISQPCAVITRRSTLNSCFMVTVSRFMTKFLLPKINIFMASGDLHSSECQIAIIFCKCDFHVVICLAFDLSPETQLLYMQYSESSFLCKTCKYIVLLTWGLLPKCWGRKQTKLHKTPELGKNVSRFWSILIRRSRWPHRWQFKDSFVPLWECQLCRTLNSSKFLLMMP